MNRTVWMSIVFVIGVAALALVCVGIATDNWLITSPSQPNNNTARVNSYNYSLGLWRKCYKTVPADVDKDKLTGPGMKCVPLELVKYAEERLPYKEQQMLHLLRATAALICACAAFQLFTLLTAILGWFQAGCTRRKESCTIITAAFLSFFALLSGMAGGTCFIATREFGGLPSDIDKEYGWSFIVTWCGTGCCLVQVLIYSIIATCHINSESKTYTLNY